MAVDSTVAGANANSYVSIAEADAYFAVRLRSDVWTSASESEKEAALRMAASILDSRVKWQGNKKTETQSMQWPRYYVKDPLGYTNYTYYLDPDVLPAFIKNAQYEQALALLEADLTKEYDSKGISQMSVGEISLTFDKSDRPLSLCRAALELSQPYAEEVLASKPTRAKLMRV